jgi:hypothetical protein
LGARRQTRKDDRLDESALLRNRIPLLTGNRVDPALAVDLPCPLPKFIRTDSTPTRRSKNRDGQAASRYS